MGCCCLSTRTVVYLAPNGSLWTLEGERIETIAGLTDIEEEKEDHWDGACEYLNDLLPGFCKSLC